MSVSNTVTARARYGARDRLFVWAAEVTGDASGGTATNTVNVLNGNDRRFVFLPVDLWYNGVAGTTSVLQVAAYYEITPGTAFTKQFNIVNAAGGFWSATQIRDTCYAIGPLMVNRDSPILTLSAYEANVNLTNYRFGGHLVRLDRQDPNEMALLNDILVRR